MSIEYRVGQPVDYLTWGYINHVWAKVAVPATVVRVGVRRIKLAFTHPETNEAIERYVDYKNVVPVSEGRELR